MNEEEIKNALDGWVESAILRDNAYNSFKKDFPRLNNSIKQQIRDARKEIRKLENHKLTLSKNKSFMYRKFLEAKRNVRLYKFKLKNAIYTRKNYGKKNLGKLIERIEKINGESST